MMAFFVQLFLCVPQFLFVPFLQNLPSSRSRKLSTDTRSSEVLIIETAEDNSSSNNGWDDDDEFDQDNGGWGSLEDSECNYQRIRISQNLSSK